MLYGYHKEPNITVVTAALNRAEFDAWYGACDNEFVSDRYETNSFEHLTNDELTPFKSTVFIFEHATPEDRQKFAEKHGLLIGTYARAVDRCTDMVLYDAPDHYDVNETRTIEELNGLDKEDRWDRRSDEEKEADKKMKEMIDEMKKKGEISNDDSFAPRKKEGDAVNVTDVRTSINADGTIDIDVLATKGSMTVSSDEAHADHAYNAKLYVKFKNHTYDYPVVWTGTSLKGAEYAAKDVYSGNKYLHDWADGEPELVVISDMAQVAQAVYDKTTGVIKASEANTMAPEVEPETNDESSSPDQETNAILTVKFSTKTVTKRVWWEGNVLSGIDEFVESLFFSDDYSEFFLNGEQPDMDVVSDTGETSRVYFEEMAGELYTNKPLG